MFKTMITSKNQVILNAHSKFVYEEFKKHKCETLSTVYQRSDLITKSTLMRSSNINATSLSWSIVTQFISVSQVDVPW